MDDDAVTDTPIAEDRAEAPFLPGGADEDLGPVGLDRSPRRLATAGALFVGALVLIGVLLTSFGDIEPPPTIGTAEAFDRADGVWAAAGLDFLTAPATLPAGEVIIGLLMLEDGVHTVAFEGVEGGEAIVLGRAAGGYGAAVDLEPGVYTYYCSIGSHREAGMEGLVEVAG